MYEYQHYEKLLMAHLPEGAQMIVSKKPYPRALVFAIDIDDDGIAEVVGGYRKQDKAYIIVLKKQEDGWRVLETVQGKSSNVNYLKVAPITAKGSKEVVVGWQAGAIWSELSIYQWKNHSLLEIAPANVYFSNIEVNAFAEKGKRVQKHTIALWKHDTGDAYQVELLQWQNDKLALAREVYPHYYKKVARYYTVLTEEFPHSPVYWYYLADAQYKTGDTAEAMRAIETAMNFEKPFPSREVLEALKKKIKIKEQTPEKMLFPASIKTKSGLKWGYIDAQGSLVIDPKYSYAMDFQKNGLAVVEDQSAKSGIINIHGEYVVKPAYDMITSFSEARAAVVDSQGYWVVDELGNRIKHKAYNYIANFKEGRALYTDIDGQGNFLYGYIDRQGKESIPMQYHGGTDFHDGKAVVQTSDTESALIGLNGEVYQTFPYGSVGAYRDGLMSFQEEPGGKYGFINEKGEIVIPATYTWAQAFAQGRAIVNSTENYINETGVIDKEGKYIITPQYNNILNLQEERYAVGKALDETQPFLGSKYAIADANGKLLTDYMYQNVSEFSRGVASVDDGERTFFINRNGVKAKNLPSVIGTGTMRLEGDGSVIKVNIDMRLFYLDSEGKVIWRQNTAIPLKGAYAVLEKKYKPNKDYFVYVPMVEGMKDKQKQQRVNKKLKQLSEVKPVNREVQLDYSYTGDFTIQFFKKQLLVLELTGYNFPFGAAHGMPTKIYPHVNLVTGEFYQLADLFNADSRYVKGLSDIIGKQIKTDPQYSYVFPDSYKGIKANQPFYVSRDALHIYFAPYEIGPYAVGFPTFTIPFTEIQKIIDKQGSFWRSFHYNT